MPTPALVRLYLPQAGGSHPGLPDVAPNANFVAIPCQETGNVLFLDYDSLEVVSSLSTGGPTTWPSVARVMPNSQKVLVSNSDWNDGDSPATNSNVMVIDVTTLSSPSVVATVPVGVGANGMAINSAGTRVYVCNLRDDSVSVIDTSTWTVIATIAVPGGPYSVRVVDTLQRAVVCCFRSASLAVINTSTNSVVADVVVGDPTQTVPDPEFGVGDTTQAAVSGPIAWAANYRSSTVKKVDVSTGEVVASYESPVEHPFGIVENVTDGLLYLASKFERRVAIVDMASFAAVDYVSMDGLHFPASAYATVDHVITDPDNDAVAIALLRGVAAARSHSHSNDAL